MVHRLRSSIRSGEGAGDWQPGVSAEPGRRRREAEALDVDRRSGAERRAERQRGLIERAALVMRGKTSLVAVANSSKGGVTIETPLVPEIGEGVRIAIPGAEPRDALVKWVRDGRVGLDFGSLPG